MNRQKERKKMNSTLYELAGDYLKLLEFAMDTGEEEAQALADTLEAVGGQIEDKAENYAKIIYTLNSTADEIDAEIKRLQARKTAIRNNAERIKRNLENVMIATGKEKFKTALFSFGIQNNPAKLVIDDESRVPAAYLIAQPAKIDNAAIKELLKAGNDVDYAHLEQSRSLRIR